MTYTMKDVSTDLKKTRALSADGEVVASAGIDLKHSSIGVVPGDIELRLEVPALSDTQLPDGSAIYYALEHSDDNFESSEETLIPVIYMQEPATSGADADSFQLRFPSSTKRYVRVSAQSSLTDTDAVDQSAKSFTIQLVF